MVAMLASIMLLKYHKPDTKRKAETMQNVHTKKSPAGKTGQIQGNADSIQPNYAHSTQDVKYKIEIHKLISSTRLLSVDERIPKSCHYHRDLVLFHRLLHKAYFAPGMARGSQNHWIPVKRGQLVTSTRKLRVEIDCSHKMVIKSLDVLKKAGLITVFPTKRGSIITIIDYERYHKSKMIPKRGGTPRLPGTSQNSTTPGPLKPVSREKGSTQFPPPLQPPQGNHINNNKYKASNFVTDSSHSPTDSNTICQNDGLKHKNTARTKNQQIYDILSTHPIQSRADRHEVYRKLVKIDHKFEHFQARTFAYLVQARSSGQHAGKFAYKLLTDPKYAPADSAWEIARDDCLELFNPREPKSHIENHAIADLADNLLKELNIPA